MSIVPRLHSCSIPRRLAAGAALVLAAGDVPAVVSLDAEHTDVATGATGTDFTVPELDARIFMKTGR